MSATWAGPEWLWITHLLVNAELLSQFNLSQQAAGVPLPALPKQHHDKKCQQKGSGAIDYCTCSFLQLNGQRPPSAQRQPLWGLTRTHLHQQWEMHWSIWSLEPVQRRPLPRNGISGHHACKDERRCQQSMQPCHKPSAFSPRWMAGHTQHAGWANQVEEIQPQAALTYRTFVGVEKILCDCQIINDYHHR